ncbi:MAG: glycosyltransferase family 4 protein [Acidimicrobiia bacterium]
MKVAFVTPRYGDEVVGGAELGARMVAERLVALRGWEVEVLTTCALQATTWADHYPAGASELRGVTVRRFPTTGRRAADFDEFSSRILHAPGDVSPADEQRWIEKQGPVAPELIDAIRASDAERLLFYPYLYHPTVCGLLEARERAVLHPAAHDELPIRLPVFRRVFGAARGLVYHTEAERHLVESLFPVAHHRAIVLGLGSDPEPGEADTARAAMGLDERPYLVCVGRVDEGKGTATLARFFAEYKRRHPGPLRLVFVGPVVHRPAGSGDVVVTGSVDEGTKWGLLRGATALVSPSAYESFSLVVLEAWNAGLPVIVNGRCEATREHVLRSGGGLLFEDYLGFEVAVERLTGDAALRGGLALRGGAYVESRYRWAHLIDRYARFLEDLRVAG